MSYHESGVGFIRAEIGNRVFGRSAAVNYRICPLFKHSGSYIFAMLFKSVPHKYIISTRHWPFLELYFPYKASTHLNLSFYDTPSWALSHLSTRKMSLTRPSFVFFFKYKIWKARSHHQRVYSFGLHKYRSWLRHYLHFWLESVFYVYCSLSSEMLPLKGDRVNINQRMPNSILFWSSMAFSAFLFIYFFRPTSKISNRKRQQTDTKIKQE